MRTLTKAEEKRRLRLYEQGLTDGQMGKILGLTRSGVQSWRRARNLKANTDPSLIVEKKSDTVPLEGQKLVRAFLRDLINFSRSKDQKPDITKFMKEWRKINGFNQKGGIGDGQS